MTDEILASRSMQQQRAHHAWNAVSGWKQITGGEDEAGKRNEGKLRTWAIKLPALILNNGLLPALAFLRAKKGEQQEVGRKCQEWLAGEGAALIPWSEEHQSCGDLVERLTKEPYAVYRVAQNEALSWAAWCKRFAEGYLEGSADDR